MADCTKAWQPATQWSASASPDICRFICCVSSLQMKLTALPSFNRVQNNQNIMKQDIYILGIESSCDDTSAAVLKNDLLLSNVTASQAVHEAYGGVVPELASRAHQQNIVPVVDQAIKRAGITKEQLTAIAFTRGPGLMGSLLVGVSFAKGMARSLGIPLIEVNHLQGHVLAHFIKDGDADNHQPTFPYLCLLVSGGNSQIIRLDADDAAGEAFDKAAKLLDAGYPGGVILDRLSREGDPGKIPFPRAMRDSLDFSFSGLKTSLLHYLKRRGEKPAGKELADIAACYQEAIVEVLVEKTFAAARIAGIGRIVVCGGVAANRRLREEFRARAEAEGAELFLPPPVLCTDNAAMIAVVGEHLLAGGCRDDIDMNAVSRWPADSGYGSCQNEA